MKIGALAPWFGGKRTMAPAIVQELGPHTQYFEPFCGSMAVLFAKPASQKETVNDLHGDAINLARTIQNREAAEELYDRLARAMVCEGLLDDARAILDGSPPPEPDRPGHASQPMIERAHWYFLASWMGRNGTAGTSRQDYQLAVRWTCGGGSPTVRFRNAVDSIPDWHRRLLGVVILQRNAFDILGRFEDAEGTAIYVDPPYPEESRTSADNPTGAYLHEFNHGGAGLFGAGDDHARTAEALRQYKHARIVVSTYDCPRYRDLYAGWTFVDHRTTKNLHAQNGRGATEQNAPELLIISGPTRASGADGTIQRRTRSRRKSTAGTSSLSPASPPSPPARPSSTPAPA